MNMKYQRGVGLKWRHGLVQRCVWHGPQLGAVLSKEVDVADKDWLYLCTLLML